MIKNITYSLVNYQQDSSSFYSELDFFIDSLLDDLDLEASEIIKDFCDFIGNNKIEILRSSNEYVVELLMIGVYWNNYSGNASKTNKLSTKFLKALYKQRKRFPSFKAEIDKLRGFLAYVSLEKNTNKFSSRYNFKGFINLMDWLSATGEFNEEVLRLRHWVAFLRTRDKRFVAKFIETALYFAEQLFEKGKNTLGKYVKDVSNFHQNNVSGYKYREDYFFASRRENEYFLNMFAAEILNRGLKKSFIKTSKKVLLLPTCMRNAPTTGCKAKSDGKELVCVSCSAECNIGKVTSEIKNENITSYLIPHSSEFSKFLVKWKDIPDIGLIGVACVLNLITGGYEMKRLDIPSQCVFLDYCGCKKHWDKDGFATSLNISQLKKIAHKPQGNVENSTFVLID